METARQTTAPPSLPAGARALVGRIGDTPLLPLPSPRRGVRVLGKAEWLNPGGSVKDRPAWSMVREALEDGRLEGRRLLDASSGNTAIAYAMLGSAIGFGVTLCLPENASPERKRTLRAYGAELVLTDALEGSDGAIRRARELARAEADRYWYADQYGNPANPDAHYRSTGPEIWRQTGGGVTHLVAGLGTSGTLAGAGRHLKERKPELELVGVEPTTGFHGIEGLKHMETALTPGIYDPQLPDRRIRVATEEAQAACRELARGAGLFVGISSGAAWAACRRLARDLEEGTVVAVLPDGGARYLSEPWWEEGPTATDGARLQLPEGLLREIRSELEAAYPREGCGVLLGEVAGEVRRVTEAVRAENRWEGRDDRYLVDPGTLRELQEREARGGPAVLGFYHSHPDAEPVPSPTDVEHAWPWYLYLVVRVDGGEAGPARAWRLAGTEDRFEERPLEVTEGAGPER